MKTIIYISIVVAAHSAGCSVRTNQPSSSVYDSESQQDGNTRTNRQEREWLNGIQSLFQSYADRYSYAARILSLLRPLGINEEDIASTDHLGGFFSRGHTRLGERIEVKLLNGDSEIVVLPPQVGGWVETQRTEEPDNAAQNSPDMPWLNSLAIPFDSHTHKLSFGHRILNLLAPLGVTEDQIASVAHQGGAFSEGNTRLGERYKVTLKDSTSKVVVLGPQVGGWVE